MSIVFYSFFSCVGMKVFLFIKLSPPKTTTFMICHLVAYDLSEVRIQISKNEVPLDYRVKRTGPLPNGDGTVQIRVQIQLSLKNTDGYCCQVQRGSDTWSKCWGRSV